MANYRHIIYEKSLEYWVKKNNKEYLLKEFGDKNIKKPNEIFKGTHKKVWWNCPDCKSEYETSVSSRTNMNSGCPFCEGQRVNKTNCLWTTNPEVAKLLFDFNDGHKYTAQSNKRVNWKCPSCGEIVKNKIISNITNGGFHCPKCSDGISYPEKFMVNFLDQLYINFDVQKSFQWSNSKIYDFYIPSIKCIIETHGRQHYDNKNQFERTLEEEQENDRLKESLAKKNGIEDYIVIDCRKSELEYIKNEIIKSGIFNLFDLTNIDWLKCHEFACNTLVKIVCDLWNSGMESTVEIKNRLKLSNVTVIKYLKQGAQLGWCDYDSKEENRKSAYKASRKRMKKVIQLTKIDKFIKEWDSATEASKILRITRQSISAVCNGKYKSAGGYKWMYKEDYDQYIKQAS